MNAISVTEDANSCSVEIYSIKEQITIIPLQKYLLKTPSNLSPALWLKRVILKNSFRNKTFIEIREWFRIWGEKKNEQKNPSKTILYVLMHGQKTWVVLYPLPHSLIATESI